MKITTKYNIIQEVPSTMNILIAKFENEEMGNECIDWANEMLCAGYTSANLVQFSKLSPDDDYIKFIGYLNVILDEFKLDIISIEDLLKSYGIHIATQAINDERTIIDVLEEFESLFSYYQYYIFYDFPFLCEAYRQLKTEGEQYIWNEELDFRNKDEYIKSYLKKWIKNTDSQLITSWNKKTYIQRLYVRYKYIFAWMSIVLVIAIYILVVYYSFKLTKSFFSPIFISIVMLISLGKIRKLL